MTFVSLSVIVPSHEGRDDVTVPRRRDWEKGTGAVTNRRIVLGFLHLRQVGEHLYQSAEARPGVVLKQLGQHLYHCTQQRRD